MNREPETTWSRIVGELDAELSNASPLEWEAFRARLAKRFSDLLTLQLELYGKRYDFYWHFLKLIRSLFDAWRARGDELRERDARCERTPNGAAWFRTPDNLGLSADSAAFEGEAAEVGRRLEELRAVGVRYVHVTAGAGDASSEEVRSAEVLQRLATELHAREMVLGADLVVAWTSDSHPWAEAAQAGDPVFRDSYWVFPERTMPERFVAGIRERAEQGGAGQDPFCFVPELSGWVWATAGRHCWDLNYSDPAVFRRMGRKLLALANSGCDVIKLLGIPYVWKEVGTGCVNLPGAHVVARAFNALVRIVSPATLLRADGSAGAGEPARYVDPRAFCIADYPLLPKAVKEAAKDRDVRKLRSTVAPSFAIPSECAWVVELPVAAPEGSGGPDRVASGAGASGGAGSGQADRVAAPAASEPAGRDGRAEGTIHTALCTFLLAAAGVPLLPGRPAPGWTHGEGGDVEAGGENGDAAGGEKERAAAGFDGTGWRVTHRLLDELRQAIAARRRSIVFAGGVAELTDAGTDGVLAVLRRSSSGVLLALTNLLPKHTEIPVEVLARHAHGGSFVEELSGAEVPAERPYALPPYGSAWLVRSGSRPEEVR